MLPIQGFGDGSGAVRVAERSEYHAYMDVCTRFVLLCSELNFVLVK